MHYALRSTLHTPERVEYHRQVGRQRARELAPGAVERAEAEPGGMEKLALERQLLTARPAAARAVDRIAGHRVADEGAMDADLVRPARLDPHLGQRVAREALDDTEVAHRRTAL